VTAAISAPIQEMLLRSGSRKHPQKPWSTCHVLLFVQGICIKP